MASFTEAINTLASRYPTGFSDVELSKQIGEYLIDCDYLDYVLDYGTRRVGQACGLVYRAYGWQFFACHADWRTVTVYASPIASLTAGEPIFEARCDSIENLAANATWAILAMIFVLKREPSISWPGLAFALDVAAVDAMNAG
jgi:hypothetical protein